ncbi:hypothetical protein FNW02_03680 [Komarekiella sp. 'clone 1']|uniref:Uncharacterized protein n=1 Tax=Komarekiella delphini-convector SJRDD-AB1 TaxID=2593771 RepID=A0AA40STH5_9NOST|nr:hypothetical protein [Komarekiella delphini-convector SJRDD-AB1]
MTTTNKIYQQVLVQLLRGENLICSFSWIFQPALSTVCSIRHFFSEVRENLASKHQLCNTNDYKTNCAAPERIAIGTSS